MSQVKIVLATKNPGKLRELKELAGQADFIEWSLAPEAFDPEETGETFLENAVIKATEAAKQTHHYTLADDSGLAVDALQGRPGVHSARYCQGSDRDRRLKLLGELSDVATADRSAHFVCTMALCSPEGIVLNTTQGIWNGRIGFEERGENGFGYDPIFYMLDRDVSAAQLSSGEKNLLSHRAQAWQKMLSFLISRQN